MHKVKGLVMMGGTLTMRGNVSPVAEANVACDPQACDQVFTSGMDITVVGLDVTMRTRLKMEHLDWLSGCCSQACRPGSGLYEAGHGPLSQGKPDPELLHG